MTPGDVVVGAFAAGAVAGWALGFVVLAWQVAERRVASRGVRALELAELERQRRASRRLDRIMRWALLPRTINELGPRNDPDPLPELQPTGTKPQLGPPAGRKRAPSRFGRGSLQLWRRAARARGELSENVTSPWRRSL